MRLKYDWFTPLNRLRSLPHDEAQSLLETATWFVDNLAKWAEQAGWQPAHLFKSPHGLAHRWGAHIPADVISFPGHRLLLANIGEHLFVYRAEPTGDVSVLLGEERTAVLASLVGSKVVA